MRNCRLGLDSLDKRIFENNNTLLTYRTYFLPFLVEEIEAMAERLVCRCLTVDIGIITPRTEEQETALNKVNKLMHEIEQQFNLDIQKTLHRAKAYLNACLSEPVGAHIDHRFQGMIIECNIDDQKKIRKRLECLVETYSPSEDLNG